MGSPRHQPGALSNPSPPQTSRLWDCTPLDAPSGVSKWDLANPGSVEFFSPLHTLGGSTIRHCSTSNLTKHGAGGGEKLGVPRENNSQDQGWRGCQSVGVIYRSDWQLLPWTVSQDLSHRSSPQCAVRKERRGEKGASRVIREGSGF